MIRKIIEINEEKCNGCGACANACHENAIAMIDGKAKLIRDDYCDGLGDCLPTCPTGAITFVEREAAAYDEEAVKKNIAAKAATPISADNSGAPSELTQWPVQIKLAPLKADYFNGADLLIAADCTAYSCGDFHNRFMKGRVTLIGCTKLDQIDYAEKLTEIIKLNDIKSVTVVRMSVPCCGGMENAVKSALQASGKFIPWQVVVLDI
ncbi:MAG: 4Fe-4S binding protein [Bacilli bacterium]